MSTDTPRDGLVGVLLLAGRRDRAVAWVRRGTLPAYVVPGARWTGVVAAGSGEAGPPYDLGAPLLAGHPLPARLRPAIGLFVRGPVALVCVAEKGWRRPTRWVVWTPGEGPGALTRMPVARPEHLAAAAGFADDPAAAEAVRACLADAGGDAQTLVEDLATLLHLPLVEVCHGVSGAALPGAELVGPAPAAIAKFTKIVSEEKRLERELEEGL